jgi:hypothetical protein
VLTAGHRVDPHRRVYAIQANVLGPERAAMIRLANQAIAHGPR